jgi:hypothetical protein
VSQQAPSTAWFLNWAGDEQKLTRDEYIASVEAAIPDRMRRMTVGEGCTCHECVALVRMTPDQRAEDVGKEYDEATADGYVTFARGGWRRVGAFAERDPFTGALIVEDATGVRQ